MDKDVAISAKNIGKTFREQLGSRSFKEAFVNAGRRLTGKREKRVHKGDYIVLKDINFEIKKGEFFGIAGRNGCGKSTLLKIIAGVYTPTKGAVMINGKLTPFIELGVGFNPELSGRDNVFLNAALLGFSRKQTEAMYDEIVDFAELKEFMDMKLKHYSSGMQVRLAFSVAIRAESDILLIDEVLAVGDEAFQRKCYDYFENLKRNKKTVVIVTHDMSAVERFCSRAMFIEDGKIVKIGDPHEVATAYSISNDESFAAGETQKATKKSSEIGIEILNSKHRKINNFSCGDDMTVVLSWKHKNVNYAGVSIVSQAGEYIFGQNTYNEKVPVTGKHQISYTVNLSIAEGKYYIVAGLFGRDDMERIDFEDKGPEFIVNRDKDDSRWGGITKLPHSWGKPV